MAVPTVSLEALTAAARAENQHAFRKITACYSVHREWVERDVKYKHYSRYGRTEMAVALGCSATVAEAYVSVGVALYTRLPLVRAAFESGEIDLPRVRTACRILDNLSDAIVAAVEAEVVEAARRSSPGPLENAIWDILLRVAPEEAAALREFAKKFRSVSYSPAGELARIRAELTAPEAAAAWQLLEEMADTLCPKDPRGKKERLCDAFMARMHGEPRLVCLCQRSDCPKAGAVLPDRRAALTMVTVDIATLIGLLANPAYLAGHGSIDPELARELARTSAWQILLTEAVTLAETLGLAVQNPDTGEWEQRPNPENVDPAPETETNTGTGTAAAADTRSAADDRSNADASAQTNPATGTAATATTGVTTPPGVTAPTAGATAPQDTPPPEPETERGRAGEGVRPDEPASTPGPVPHVAAPGPEPGSAQTHAATRASTSETDSTSEPVSGPTSEPTSGSTPEPTTGSVTGSMSETGREPAASPASAATAQRAEGTASSKPDPARETAESESSATTSETETGTSAETETGTSAGTESASESISESDSAVPADSGDQHQRRLQSLTSAAALFCTHTPAGRGTRHSSALDLSALDLSALPLTFRESAKHADVQGIHLGPASLAAALEAAIAADPTLGKSVSRDPLTDRALIYRPDALTTAAVRFRDRHCRFPGCQRPAERCQLDHITPFDHANPLGGGWSTINNLQCLCAFHHAVKTAGYWNATMLPGGAILWRSTSKTTRITLPANGTTVPVLGNDLRPHIPTKPKRSGIIAYPHPPEDQEPESTAEESDEPRF